MRMSASPSPARDSQLTSAGPTPTKTGRRKNSSSLSKADAVAGKAPSFEDGRITVCVRARPLSNREAKLSAPATASATAPSSGNNDAPPSMFAGGPNCLHFFEDGKTVMVFDGGVPSGYAELSREQIVALHQRRTHTFTFDSAYGSEVPQEKVYSDMGTPVLGASWKGFNTCIFAYGQTGSGKSYCMMGPDGGRNAGSAPGIIPRLCHDLFEQIATAKRLNREEIERATLAMGGPREAVETKDATAEAGETQDEEALGKVLPPELDVSVYVSYLEIYREKVRCLLNPKHDNLKVRQHPQLGVYVEGLKEVPVTHEEQIGKLMRAGTESRHTASTNMNDTSSRSHAIFQVQLIQKRKSTTKDGATKTTELRARINLVDLAGSERAKATGAEGETLKEGAQINKSLTTLGLVISTLADLSSSNPSGTTTTSTTAKHVPYRDSTLTFLLKESLGGNSKTYMLSTLSPATINYEETLSTLRYADRAKQIVTRAFVNETASDKRIRELEDEVTRLRDKIQAMMAQQARRDTSGGSPSPNNNSPHHPRGSRGRGSRHESNSEGPSRRMSEALLYDEELVESLPSPLDERQPASSGAAPETVSSLNVTDTANHEADAVDEDVSIDLDEEDATRQPPTDTPEEEAGTTEDTDDDTRRHEDPFGEESSPTTAVAAEAASPTSVGGSDGVDVEALRSELQRAEEVIRQLTATETERDQEAGDAVAEVRAQSTVKLSRRDPYLMNLDGLGDWVAAHLVGATAYLGAPGDITALGGPASAAHTAARESGEGSEGDEDLEDDGDPSPVAKPRRLQYITVAVLAEDGDSIGCPHCKLSRDPASNRFSLLPCEGFDTFVNHDPTPIDEGGYTLQNGDVVTLGDVEVGPQVKFMDPAQVFAQQQQQQQQQQSSPAQPLLTARGARTRVGFVVGAGSPRGAALASSPKGPHSPSGAGGLVPPLNIPNLGELNSGGITRHADPSAGDGSCGDRKEYSMTSQLSYTSSSGFGVDDTPTAMESAGLAPTVPALQLGHLAKKDTPPPREKAAGMTNVQTEKPSQLLRNSAAAPVPALLGKNEEAENYFGGGGGRATDASSPSSAAVVVAPAGVLKGGVVVGQTLPCATPVTGVVRKGTLLPTATPQVGQTPMSGPSRFIGRHTLLFLGPSGAGKTHSRENLREPDRWYDFLAKRAATTVKPTWGVDHCIVEVASDGYGSGGGDDGAMSLNLLELSGRACFSLLQDQLPSRRVTYVLCFSLRGNPSLQVFRPTLESILCQSDHRDASVVLLATHLNSAQASSTGQVPAAVHRLLDDMEQQVQNFFLLLQPNAELRPNIVGRFAVDNAQRRVFSAGFTRVSTFPELLRWFGDQAQQRCRNDLDFLNGRIPLACSDKLLGMVKHMKNKEGRWCVSALAYKARARSLEGCYQHAHTLHVHTQLLGHWGLLIHRFRHAKMKAHIVVDVPWYLRLLSCVACCGAAAADRPDEMLLCTHPIMHAYDPRSLCFHPDRVIFADAYGLLSRGVMTTKVLATIVGGLLASESPTTAPHGAKERPDLPGIIELFQVCDYVVPGRKLSFSPEKETEKNQGRTPTPTEDKKSDSPLSPSSSSSSAFFESFLLLPSAFHHAAPPTVVLHTARLLTGPFYRFTFTMVPPFFFAKLTCRIANSDDNGCERVYLGPVQRWFVESDGPHFPLYTGDGTDAGLPRPPQPRGTTVPGNQEFWANTAWAVGGGGARALLRMVKHSLFITFNCTSTYKLEDAAFYEDLLASVRSVVAESPGTRCEESILCCFPEDLPFPPSSATGELSVSAGQRQLQETMLETDPTCFYHPVSANINSLEKIREREAAALQTARIHRPVKQSRESGENGESEYGNEEDEEEHVPFLRSFADTPLHVERFLALVEETFALPAALKQSLTQRFVRLTEARESCADCPNDGSDASVLAAQAVGDALDAIVDALANMK